MRGRRQDGVDGRIAEDGVEIAGQRDAAREAKIVRTFEVGFDRAGYFQPRIAACCLDKGAAPSGRGRQWRNGS